ncbi:hypothetical protein JCM33374_g3296 [Metschnikowia sp. JCM 33374]|nr:hypothetical protein JCM33374_g3296 [Metschnikowia sp. JCM 33374]
MTQKQDTKPINNEDSFIDGLSGKLKKLEVSEKAESVAVDAGHQQMDEPQQTASKPGATEIDAKTFRLLDLLDEYESLANDSFRVNFTNGFLDLSRANYYGSQRYGVDSIDRRPRDASTIVESSEGKISIKDKWLLYKQRMQEEKKSENQAESGKGTTRANEGKDGKNGKEEKDTEPTPSKGSQKASQVSQKASQVPEEVTPNKGSTESKPKQGAVSSARAPGQELRSRNTKQKAPDAKDNNTTKEIGCSEDAQPQDPIHQFGRMVPYQLRAAQGHFQKALSDSIQLLHLQQEIASIVASLQA